MLRRRRVGNYIARAINVCACISRRRVSLVFGLLIIGVFTIAVWNSVNGRLEREHNMQLKLINMENHLKFLKTLYVMRLKEFMSMQARLTRANDSNQIKSSTKIILEMADKARLEREHSMLLKFIDMANNLMFLKTVYVMRLEEIMSMQAWLNNANEDNHIKSSTEVILEMADNLKDLNGTITDSHAASGLRGSSVHMATSYVYQLLPHLLSNPKSLRPAFHMKGSREFSNTVIGIPTVKRYRSYLLLTLEYLIKGLEQDDVNKTLIIVYVGETDLKYVYQIARQIEYKFSKYVEKGLIEVISPHSSYYPDFKTLSPTLGDSKKRFQWRTKQNLDILYLMAYARTKGTYYLMLEDDVISVNNYMREIKTFTAEVSISNPNWFYIEFSPLGSIGKLFRSSDLLHFITYIQLFYYNLPMDWLLESYTSDRACNHSKNSSKCGQSKVKFRPQFKSRLFLHIGLHSSLKGKIFIKDGKFRKSLAFYSHDNPPIKSAETDIKEYGEYTILNAYRGNKFFWGERPKKGNTITFTFLRPTTIDRYVFRSSNPEHISDKFLNTDVEVLPVNASNFTRVGTFDEFGLAEGSIKNVGPIKAIRLRVTNDLTFWVILSEIELVEFRKPSNRPNTKGHKYDGTLQAWKVEEIEEHNNNARLPEE